MVPLPYCDVGIAVEHAHGIDRDPQLVGDDLGEGRGRALAMGRQAGEDGHRPGRIHADAAALPAPEPGGADMRRREAGDLDIGAETDPDEPARSTRVGLVASQAIVLGDGEELVEGAA
jgi:hypothetical protein